MKNGPRLPLPERIDSTQVAYLEFSATGGRNVIEDLSLIGRRKVREYKNRHNVLEGSKKSGFN